MNRRDFLKALGLTGASALLPGTQAFAQDGGGPIRRLIVLSTAHGTVYDGWKMHPDGLAADQPWAYNLSDTPAEQFSRALSPLHAHRNRLNIVDGLSMTSAELDIAGYRHEKGMLHGWTGEWVTFPGNGLFAGGPSLDQIVSRQIARADHIPSLDLSVAYGRPICHAGPMQELPLEQNPARAWERVFGLSTSSDPLVRGQGSVLDFVTRQMDSFATRLGLADKQRVDQHLQLVRQLEQRIQGLANATCEAPARPASSAEDYIQTFRSHAEIVASAFSCDLTRVATISMGDLPSRDFGWGGYLSGDVHNDFAHRIYDDPQAALAMTDYQNEHCKQVSWLIELLESIPDPQGGSLMDHTLIVWGGELADGWHGYKHFFMMTAGGDWALKQGQYVRRPYGNTPVDLVTPAGEDRRSGTPHHHMLVSVAQAMGVDTDHVGIKQLETRNGDKVDLTGPLAEIMRT